MGRGEPPLEELIDRLGRDAGLRLARDSARRVGGGSINEVIRLEGAAGPVLIKLTSCDALDMFEAEAAGLAELRGAGAVAVPRCLGVGRVEQAAYLVLEWLDLVTGRERAEARLGAELAALHARNSESFGWYRDNTIGAAPQSNARRADWLDFYAELRLGAQLERAVGNGLPAELAHATERVIAGLEVFFAGYRPASSLLHGDLWGGNWGATRDARPYVFDPAVYYGDREADLAMTRLFGGFGAAFYESYERSWPLAPGAGERADLYDLYHLLNHYNLFGEGYLNAVATRLKRLEQRL